jgi:predicted ABC-type ATPase
VNLLLDRRPAIVALAGANGAGKSTFYHAQLAAAGLRFVNADVLSRELKLGPYEAAKMADSLRRELVKQRESLVFETVFSDPAGDKLAFLKDAATAGYTVILCFIGISGPEVSEQRVAMRVSQGGHDVPTNKLETRYPRVLANLRNAIRKVPHVWIFDNDDLRHPYRLIAIYQAGKSVRLNKPIPRWLSTTLVFLET